MNWLRWAWFSWIEKMKKNWRTNWLTRILYSTVTIMLCCGVSFGFWALAGAEQVPGSLGRSLVSSCFSHLFLVCPHHCVFLRTCRRNQSSPDCLTSYCGNSADSCASLWKNTIVLLTLPPYVLPVLFLALASETSSLYSLWTLQLSSRHTYLPYLPACLPHCGLRTSDHSQKYIMNIIIYYW